MNPVAIVLIALCTLVGLLWGSWLIGAILGLSIVLVATFIQ